VLSIVIAVCASCAPLDVDDVAHLDGPAPEVLPRFEGPVFDMLALAPSTSFDPFDVPTSDAAPCTRGFTLASTSIDVETGICPYALLEASLPTDLPAGTRLSTQVFHDYLNAPEPAEGHVVVAVGDVVVADLHVAIPSTPNLHLVDVTLPHAVDAGAPVLVHVHNHGSNSWRILSVEAVP